MELGVTITIEKDANVDERRKDIKRIREKDQKTNTCPLFGQKKKKTTCPMWLLAMLC